MASPCFPSPCTILFVVPSSSSHKYVDAVPQNMEMKPLLHALSECLASWPTAR